MLISIDDPVFHENKFIPSDSYEWHSLGRMNSSRSITFQRLIVFILVKLDEKLRKLKLLSTQDNLLNARKWVKNCLDIDLHTQIFRYYLDTKLDAGMTNDGNETKNTFMSGKQCLDKFVPKSSL